MITELQKWEALIEPIPKTAIPIEFIKQIVFYYPNNEEVVIDLSMITTELKSTLESWIEENYAKTNKISMIVDVAKIQAFIEPITTAFLDDYVPR